MNQATRKRDRARLARHIRTTGLSLAMLAGFAQASTAQPGKCLVLAKDGAVFRAAEESTTFDKRFPKVETDAAGNYVVIWESFGTKSGTDSDRGSVQGRRFAADGTPRGGQFQANTLTKDEQRFPDVGMAADGRFVVVWQSGTPFGEKEIRARLYRADGTPEGNDFLVNTTPFNPGGSSSSPEPRVSMGADGSFVVVWGSETTTGNDTSARSLQAQRFGADGSRRGGQFQANTLTDSNQYLGDVGVAPNGDFIIAWNDGRTRKTHIRKFAASGAPISAEHQVGERTALDIPGVAIAPQGHALITWTDNGSTGSDDDRTSIQAQGLDASGALLGPTFQINQVIEDNQFDPNVGAGPGGDFVVAWTSDTTNGDDTSGSSVQARHIAAPNRFFDVQFQLNTETNSGQANADVALGPQGAVGVYFSTGIGQRLVWESMVQPLSGTVSPDSLCLSQKRFLVEVDWRDFSANTGKGSVVAGGSDDSGLFWFFDSDNWEMLVKVIDGCPLNQRFWVFAAATTDVQYDLKVTDLWSGEQMVYSNPLGRSASAITDSTAFATCDLGSRQSAPTTALDDSAFDESSPASMNQPSAQSDSASDQTQLPGWQTGASSQACSNSGSGLCLSGNRFLATVDWKTSQGTSGSAQRVPFGSDDSGLFWFFNKDNWEMLIKVIDGCALNGHYWIFSAATTDVEYTLTVEDTVRGTTKEYFNPLNTAAPAITDTAALPCQ